MLSLVTGTRNRPDDFRRLVDSIERHTPMKWELVVSDASDMPIQNEPVATDETWPKIRVIPERPRLGYSRGFNQAFRQARGKWVIFLNDDAEVTAGYAEAAIRFMESHPKIGLGALYYSNRGGPFMVNQHEGMIYANFGIMRRTFGNKIGWLDEDLVMYGSDNALAFKVLLAGLGVAGIPDSRIIHHECHDEQRMQNQHGRYAEADKLAAKYGPKLSEMRAVYEMALRAA